MQSEWLLYLTCWPVSTRLHLKCGLSMRSEGFVVDAGDAHTFSDVTTVDSIRLS